MLKKQLQDRLFPNINLFFVCKFSSKYSFISGLSTIILTISKVLWSYLIEFSYSPSQIIKIMPICGLKIKLLSLDSHISGLTLAICIAIHIMLMRYLTATHMQHFYFYNLLHWYCIIVALKLHNICSLRCFWHKISNSPIS